MCRYCFVILVSVLWVSCSEKTKVSRLEAERDSILVENERLNSFIDVVSGSMDSIIVQEGEIFRMPNVEGIPVPSREQIRENLDVFEDLLNRQRQRIAQLEDSLANVTDGRISNLKSLVGALRRQIEEKDNMIAGLRSELDDKNANIQQLQSRVSVLDEKTRVQEEVLAVQTEMLNEGYVKMGTRKELQKAGLISGSGLFSKKKLDVSNFNTDNFTKVDIRNFQELVIEGKNPKILTPMPSSAYRLDKKEKDVYILTIIDPSLFWSVSNFLVIQYK